MKNRPSPKPVWLSEIVDAPPVEWIWHQRIPRRHLTILEGAPGKGKGMMLCDIASRLSRAKALPDVPETQRSFRMMRTLFLSQEDDGPIFRARVTAADGELSCIGVLEEPMSFPNDGEVLSDMVHDYGVDLLVVDPINSYLSPKTDSYRDNDVRQALAPLRNIARRENAGVVLIRHLIKSGQGPALSRGIGSIGFTGLARVVLQLVPHGEGFALAWAKGNLSKAPSALPYTIEGDENPRVIWGEPIPGSADDLLSGSTETGSPSDRKCAEFIIERLKQSGGNVLSAILEKEGASYGFNIPVLKRAKALLKNEGKAYSKKVGESWFVVMNQGIKGSEPYMPDPLIP